jgi:putative glycerol-1-phosphate prenyltransferase
MIYQHLLNIIVARGAAYLILLDPDKLPDEKLVPFVTHCEKSGVDGFLVGGSLIINGDFKGFIGKIKKTTSLPVIIFPGEVNQVCNQADAILFLSVVSGRNPEHLIGKHVLAAPLIKKSKIEPISTGYIIVESGSMTTAEYISGSLPVPRNKPEIASATALAAQYLGMKLIYLEAGSGASQPVPNEMVKAVSEYCNIPIVVGGGIKSPHIAREKVDCGAQIIVTGNFFENNDNWGLIGSFADAIHYKNAVTV